MDDDDLIVLVDFVYDAAIAAPARPQTFEIADEWLSNLPRILGECVEDQ